MEVTQKWVNLGLLVGSGIAFLFLSQALQLVWDLSRLPVPQGWVVGPPSLISFGLASVAGFVTRRQPRANSFLNEVALELSKVTWPGRKETVASTGVVLVLVAIASVILFLLDALWGTVARGFL